MGLSRILNNRDEFDVTKRIVSKVACHKAPVARRKASDAVVEFHKDPYCLRPDLALDDTLDSSLHYRHERNMGFGVEDVALRPLDSDLDDNRRIDVGWCIAEDESVF
jgi:hypothetical protein